MTSLTFKNKKETSLKIGKQAPFLLQSIDGLGDVPADIQTQKAPYLDGTNFIDSILEPRPIPITFSILAENYNDLSLKKRLVSEVFNPKHGLGLLTYEFYGRVYEIEAISESVPQFPSGTDNRGMNYQRVAIDLLAPDPYWKSPQINSEALRAYQGLFKMPHTFPIELGISGDTTILLNDGETVSPVTIDIQGPVTNPQIINRTTGERIRINRDLSADEVLHIDTNDRNKRVEIYRNGRTIEKALGYLDHDSTFWKLEPGNNEIDYIADAGNLDGMVSISWRNLYTGI